jgi:hypothetical protein
MANRIGRLIDGILVEIIRKQTDPIMRNEFITLALRDGVIDQAQADELRIGY